MNADKVGSGASDDRHAEAVARSLLWADEAAARGDHANALGWLEAVLAIGDELPGEFQRKRAEWLLILRERDSTRDRAHLERPRSVGA